MWEELCQFSVFFLRKTSKFGPNFAINFHPHLGLGSMGSTKLPKQIRRAVLRQFLLVTTGGGVLEISKWLGRILRRFLLFGPCGCKDHGSLCHGFVLTICSEKV